MSHELSHHMPVARILVVEDDNDINRLIHNALVDSAFNYEVFSAFSGTEAVLLSKEYDLDLILLDLMLPGLNGKEVLDKIRQHKNTPVIVISAKSDRNTKIELLNIGADDYIVKPFDIEEMLSRIYAVLRRYRNIPENQSKRLIFKKLELDRDARQAYVAEKSISFTMREFEILQLLMEHPKMVFSRAKIYETLWNEEYLSDESTVNVHISNIRAKISAHDSDEYIKTVWGIGFKLAD